MSIVQEAIKAIRETVAPVIDPDEDYLTIVAAEERFSASEAKRRKESEHVHATFKALSKILESAKTSSTRPATVPSPEAHAATLRNLEESNLSSAKSISDAEGLFIVKDGQLKALKEERRRLEQADSASEHEQGLDSTALRLHMFHTMGFNPIVDKSGRLVKMLVRSQSGDVHCLDLQSAESPVDFTQSLWTAAVS